MASLYVRADSHVCIKIYAVVGALTALWGLCFIVLLEAGGIKFYSSVAFGTAACIAGWFIMRSETMDGATKGFLYVVVTFANVCMADW